MRRNPSLFLLTAVSLACVLILAACNCAPTLRYITVSPTSALIDACTTQQLTLTAYYSDGTTKVGAATGLYTSSNPAVATVDSTGVVSALTIGTTTITVAAAGTSGASAVINVQQLKALVVTPLNPTIAAEATQQFKASGVYTNPDGSVQTTPSDVTGITTWTSSNTEAATIDNTTHIGLATGVSNGTSIITASVDCLTASTTLTVGSAVPVLQSLVVTATPSTIAVTNISALTVMEKWSDGSTKTPSGTVTWSSSAPGTAGVVSAIAPTPTYDGIAAGVAAGTATITATEGSVTGTAALTVVQGTAKYAFVAIHSDNDIEYYGVNAGTAPYLTPVGTASIQTPTQPFLYPSNAFIYTLDELSDIWLWNVAVGIPSLPNGSSPQAVAKAGTGITANYASVDPYGRFLYVTEHSTVDNIWAYTINSTTGALTAVAGSPFGTGFNLSNPQYVTVDRTGQYLYVVNQNSGTVSAYSIDQTTGALTVLAAKPTIATGSSPQFGALDPAGKNLYVANNGAGSVSSYSIGAGGVLASTATTTVTGANEVLNVAVDPTDKYLYVLDAGDGISINGALYGYALSSGVPGTTPITGTGPSAHTGLAPTGIAIDPTSVLIAVDNSGDVPGDISLFTIGSGGGLTVDTPVAAGVNPIGAAPYFVIFAVAP